MARTLSIATLAVLAFAGSMTAAAAQSIDFANQPGVPVEVYADKGLELSQDAKTLIAHGNARAVRGRVTITADTLVAHYRERNAAGKPGTPDKAAPAAKTGPTAKPGDETPQGSSEVWRLEADGHVHIFTESQQAFADHADYNIDDAVAVLTGKNLKLVTTKETVTARDSLEYWENRQQAVARGKAVASQGDKHIQGDTLVADYGQDQQKHTVLRHATGFGNVIMTTADEIVKGDRADYDPQGGLVTVTGAVKMTRGDNQLDGGYAVVNLNTGISRLYPTAPGQQGGDTRVKGLLTPNRKLTEQNPSGAEPATNEPPPTPPKSP